MSDATDQRARGVMMNGQDLAVLAYYTHLRLNNQGDDLDAAEQLHVLTALRNAYAVLQEAGFEAPRRPLGQPG